jgi:hypothetical protein
MLVSLVIYAIVVAIGIGLISLGLAFVKDEDFSYWWTDVRHMEDESFFLFWLTYNFGGEVVDPIRQLGEYDYIYVGAVLRRNEPYEIWDMRGEVVAIVNMDRAPSVIPLPYNLWQYAFENEGPDLMLNPRSQVKVVFTSYRAGLVVKVPASTLLLLAQDRFDIGKGTKEDYEALLRAWERFYVVGTQLNDMFEAARAGGGTSFAALGATLEVRRDTVEHFAKLFEGEELAPAEFFFLAEEIWRLKITRGMDKAGVSPSDAQAGDVFRWVPVYQRTIFPRPFVGGPEDYFPVLNEADNFAELAEAWGKATNPRFYPVSTIGEQYGINTKYSAWAWHDDVRWGQVPAQLFVPGPAIVPEIADTSDPTVQVRELPREAPDNAEVDFAEADSAGAFVNFWAEIGGTPLTLLESHQGYLLFHDSPTEEYPAEDFVAVKVASMPFAVRGYWGGLASYFNLIQPRASVVRVFVLDLGQACLEYETNTLQILIDGGIAVAAGNVVDAAGQLLFLRNESLLNVDLVIGDIFSNWGVAANRYDLISAIVDCWAYDAAAGKWVPSGDVDVVDEVRTAVLAKAGAIMQKGPLDQFLEMERLRFSDPGMHEEISAYLSNQVAGKGEEEEAEGEEEDEDVLWFQELMSNPTRPVPRKLIGAQGPYNIFQEKDGTTWYEFKDDDYADFDWDEDIDS